MNEPSLNLDGEAAPLRAGGSGRELDRAVDLELELGAAFTGWSHRAGARYARDLHADARLRAAFGDEVVCRPGNPAALRRYFESSAMPAEPASFDRYLDQLLAEVVPFTVNVASPRCLAHMTAPLPDFIATVARVAVALNQNLVKQQASRAFTLLERQVLATLHRLLFAAPDEFYRRHALHDDSVLGLMTSGGTLANLSALWIARNAAFAGTGDVEADGMAAALSGAGSGRAVIVGSQLMHYSIDKAAGILGLGERGVLKLPVSSAGAIDLGALARCLVDCRDRNLRVVAVVGVAGSTDRGSVDPLGAVADLAHEAGAWFHVDAAWGAPLAFSRRHAPMLAGIERADSITVDAHKQMHVPVGTSMLLLKDPAAARVIRKVAGYMLQDNSGDQGRCSVEGSRPAGAVYVHAALHVFGRSGFERLIDHRLELAQAMADLIRARRDFELLAEPQTNIVIYRHVPEWAVRADVLDALNERIQALQFAAGHSLVSRTTLAIGGGERARTVQALRAVVANPRTTVDDLAAVLDEQARIAEQVR